MRISLFKKLTFVFCLLSGSLTLEATNVFAGGIICKQCPSESEKCIPREDCKKESCSTNVHSESLSLTQYYTNRRWAQQLTFELVHYGSCTVEEVDLGFVNWIWEKPGKAGLMTPACVEKIVQELSATKCAPGCVCSPQGNILTCR